MYCVELYSILFNMSYIMNYQVFARKWRPKKFEDIVGQEYVIKAITHSLNLNKIHHAYILSGARGTGKTTIARLFAKSLNCEKSITVNICGLCKNCKDIDLGCFIDLIEIDAASRTKVEDTYEVLDSVQYVPVQGRFKVYLIDEIHMLSKYSFNALLKVLEEPPEHVKFILITTEYQKIPDTILSRCLQFYLKPLNASQIVLKLTNICNEEKISVDVSALELLAYSAKGSMRDALNLLEQAILLGNDRITNDVISHMLGLLHIEETLSLVENLIDRNIDGIMKQIDHYSALGINWDFLFEEILSIFQKMAMCQFALNASLKSTNIKQNQHFAERIYTLSNRVTPEDIQLYYQIFLLGRRELPDSPSYRMGMEMTILRALVFYPTNISLSKNHANNTHLTTSSDNQDNSYGSVSENQKDIKNIQKNTDIFINKPVISNTINKNICSNNITHDVNDISTNNSVKSVSISNDAHKMISNDVTAKILKVRSKLLHYKTHYHILRNNEIDLNTNEKHQKKSKNVLERFSNININASEKHMDNIKKKK